MKKNNIPAICIWVLYSLATVEILFLTAMSVASVMGYGAVAGLIAGIAVLLVSGLLVWGVHVLIGKHEHGLMARDSRRQMISLIAESLLLIGFLAGMTAVRLMRPWNVTQDLSFELARVTAEKFVPGTAHCGYKLYLYLLHGSFLLLGNKALAAIILQLILLICAALSLYFGIRRLSGAVAALAVTAFLGFSPFMLAETGKLLPFLLFLIFYGLAIRGIAALPDRMRGLCRLQDRILGVLYYIYVGLLVGICLYLDAAGITLLIFLTGVICCGRREKEVQVKREPPEGIVSPEAYLEAMERESVILGSEVFVFLCCLATAVLGYVGAHVIRSLGGGSLKESIYGQLELYMPGSFRIPTTMGAGAVSWDVPLLAVLASLGVFGFWHSGKIRDKAVWLSAAALMVVMQCTGMTSEPYSDGFAILYLCFAAMAGCSLADLTAVRQRVGDDGNRESLDDMNIQDDMDIRDNLDRQDKRNGLPDGGAEQENPCSSGQEEAPVINYIENPLPLPKKHKPRVLDYDYEVSETDDFDIQ